MIKTDKVAKSTPSLKGIRFALLAAAIAAALPAAAGLTAITTRPDILGKQLPAGFTAWFNSVLRPTGVPLNLPVTICVTQQTIAMRHGVDTDIIELPDAVVSFKPWETQSTTSSTATTWITSAPTSQATRDTFMSGDGYPLPLGFPADSSTMTWTARVESDTPGISVQWQWGAAAYTQFTDDNNALMVEAGNRRHVDGAGVPVAFKQFAIGDVADGSRFTGLRSITASVSAEVTGHCGGVY